MQDKVGISWAMQERGGWDMHGISRGKMRFAGFGIRTFGGEWIVADFVTKFRLIASSHRDFTVSGIKTGRQDNPGQWWTAGWWRVRGERGRGGG